MIESSSVSFEKEVLHSNLPVVVEFLAPWCGVCNTLSPLLTLYADRFEGRVKFVSIDIENEPSLAEIFEIRSVPTLILFRGGECIDQLIGMPRVQELDAWINQAAEPQATS